MKKLWDKYRFLFLRRTVQISLMVLYFGANAWGWTFLTGNLSSSSILGLIPMSDPYAALQMFAAGALITTNLAIGVLIVIILYGLLGRVFCSWVCPVNLITDLSSYLRRTLGFNQIQKRQPATRNIRYWVIVISLVISIFMGVTAFEFISPISMVHRGIIFGLGFGWAAILIIFLFDLLVLKNGWCGHICPLGGFYSILGKYSIVRVDHDAESCTACMKCKEVCPEVQVLGMISKESKQVSNSECTNCGRCIEVCDDGSLEFSIIDRLKQK
jgi:ferredoxin-type protein NapH